MIGFNWEILLVIGLVFIITPLFLMTLVFVGKKIRKKKIKKKDMEIIEYFKSIKDDDKLAIIDETPRPFSIGDRFYMLSPLKYRQFTRICILFAKVMKQLSDEGISADNIDDNFDKAIEMQEHEFFRCLAYVLYFSRNPKEDVEENIVKGVEEEYNYLKNNASINEVSRLLQIIVMQNDIKRALSSFGNFVKKKDIVGK